MRDVVPRKLDFDFEAAALPRHWLADDALATHMANALNLIFPTGERFFVRSVRNYLDAVQDDPVLLERVRGFCAQEGHHAHAHERFFEVLRGQGYDVDSFLSLYRRVAWERLEPRFDPVMRLSVTVALEHYTAMFAENALTQDFLDHAPPVMRRLLRWHAAEEIEHKDVAFDVLAKVDPRYRTRIIGMALATAGLLAFWIVGTAMLMKQENLPIGRLARQVGLALVNGQIGNGDMRRAFIAYLKPGFHPRQIENDALAAGYLAGLLAGAA